ncbi:MAG: efflux RND transporter periplasmic adaptor subunit [Methylotenera sp.]|uniref:efflux RND transporter periplasmic adaptor subunit n=1 Tax=Methylotenera sp. TaxID=2051956 RepID=UPI002488CF82|nr:efflux RND transporter periplasmic adaptor subunit [Methylotenera sp.]MDI1309636.1 efflux RND transporter periplasmic adaptor subunit [Methylotenera sp.]
MDLSMCSRIFKSYASLLLFVSIPAFAEPLVTSPVLNVSSASLYKAEGVVESAKSTQIATEMQGGITMLSVKAGDIVKAGQVLVRIDARAARQQIAGSQAQAAATNAQLSAAKQAYERKKRLYEKNYLSQAALEQAEAEFKTAQAQVRAQQSNISIANVGADLHTIVAPYSGVVAEVNVELGDMALPGNPLLSIYDPKVLRIVASVPQNRISQLNDNSDLNIEIPDVSKLSFNLPVKQMIVLPTADMASHQVKVRINIPESLMGTTRLSPGMFARVGLPVVGSNESSHLLVPATSVMRRGEVSLLYIVKQGKPQLRQVRVGLKQMQGTAQYIEILSGVEAGEQAAVNPLAALNLIAKSRS